MRFGGVGEGRPSVHVEAQSRVRLPQAHQVACSLPPNTKGSLQTTVYSEAMPDW